MSLPAAFARPSSAGLLAAPFFARFGVPLGRGRQRRPILAGHEAEIQLAPLQIDPRTATRKDRPADNDCRSAGR